MLIFALLSDLSLYILKGFIQIYNLISGEKIKFEEESYKLTNEFTAIENIVVRTINNEIVVLINGEGEYKIGLYLYTNNQLCLYNGINSDLIESKILSVSISNNNRYIYILVNTGVLYLYDIYTLLYMFEWKYKYIFI